MTCSCHFMVVATCLDAGVATCLDAQVATGDGEISTDPQRRPLSLFPYALPALPPLLISRPLHPCLLCNPGALLSGIVSAQAQLVA